MGRTDIAKAAVMSDLGKNTAYEEAMAGFLVLEVFEGEGFGKGILDNGRDERQSGAVRVLLGTDLYGLWAEKLKDLNSTHAAMEQIASSVEMDE